MGRYLGSWQIDDTLTWTVNTHDASTGAATDDDSVPSYRVYEDETGTPILTGSMAKLDDANTTGFYSEQITLSAANGFEKGKSYNIYVAATVDSVVGTDSFGFQVGMTAEDALDVDTYAEPTGVPPATDTLANKLGRLYMALRNQIDITATKKTFYDDGGAAEWEKDLSDDGTTYSETEGNAV